MSDEAYPAPDNRDFHTAVRHRRTIYGISGDIGVPDERIREIVYDAVKHTPSAFNSQSTRLVVLLKEHHHKLWEITTATLRKLVNDAEKFASTADKMASFRSGYGTVLFFEDQDVVLRLQEQFAAYAIVFRYGRSIHQPCTNLSYGRRWNWKDSALPCSITIRSSTTRLNASGTCRTAGN